MQEHTRSTRMHTWAASTSTGVIRSIMLDACLPLTFVVILRLKVLPSHFPLPLSETCSFSEVFVLIRVYYLIYHSSTFDSSLKYREASGRVLGRGGSFERRFASPAVRDGGRGVQDGELIITAELTV